MQATNKTETVQQPECPQAVRPQAEYEWLRKLVGSWSGEGEAAMAPGQPPVKWSLTEEVRAFGGLWVVAESVGEVPGGGTGSTIMTIGYDPKKEHYVGTFVAAIMTHLWVYEGALSEDGTVLTLNTEGPGMSPNTPSAKYKDLIEFQSGDQRTLTSLTLGSDGEWQQVMTVTYRRTA